jgi:dTDP-4-dehydrorhamnose 3,5-epimerase
MGKFEKIPTQLKGVAVIRPKVFPDDRGFFLETFNKQEFAEVGINYEFVQDNVSHSRKGVIRGLHYQSKQAQGKLVRVIRGKIFDVAVDIREGSPTYGHYVGLELSEEIADMLYVPVGFAHGFLALEDDTEVMYKVTDYYAPNYDTGICWNDPFLNIVWPLKEHGIQELIVSSKDAGLPGFEEIISPFQFR